MIPRLAKSTLERYASGFPAICITGPRQSGKTTLAKMAFPDKPYMSLEDPDIAVMARSDVRGFLETYQDGLIIDEAQYAPELFLYLKSYIDKDPKPGKYIVTGSQQFNLMENITESLAGRAAFLTLLPFSISELATVKETAFSEDPFEVMVKGLFPPLYDRDVSSYDFFTAYIASYIERDLRQLLNVKDLSTFQKFFTFCAARIGSILNLSSLASDCEISHNTAKAWISILETSGLVYLLKPYYKNYGKRLVKSPKLYFTDPGLACRALGILTKEQLFMNPLRGNLFEGFIIGELLKQRLNKGLSPDLWFFRDNTGLEIDCLIEGEGNLTALEIKSGKTFSNDMLKGLESWQRISSIPAKDGNCILVYAGSNKSNINEIKLLPWNEIAS